LIVAEDIVALPAPKKNQHPAPGACDFNDKQLSLFQNFLCNSEDEEAGLSNAVAFWDSIPRYALSQQAMQKMRDRTSGFLPMLSIDYQHEGQPYRVTLTPARFVEDGKQIEYYPSANEELVEEVLRKILLSKKSGFYHHNQKDSGYGVTFTIYEIREHLARSGHARSHEQIVKSLQILHLSNLRLEKPAGKKYRPFISSTFLPLLAGATREDLKVDPTARWVAQFHPIIEDAIEQLSYRQFNFVTYMSHRLPLTRWLHKYLIHKYHFASMMASFELRYSTIARDSAMLRNYARARDARNAVTEALNELQAQDIIRSHTQSDVVGDRQKVVDVVYALYPTKEFVAEIKAANLRQKNNETPALLVAE
jgi:hypothetical protein